MHRATLVAVGPAAAPVAGPRGHDEADDGPPVERDRDEGIEIDPDPPRERCDVRLVVTEGKHRMVRRMLANVGHPVDELRRLRHGEVELGDLKEGEFREATEPELEWARSLIK